MLKEVLATIKQMETDGVFERYALGGAVAATFYLEPIATVDVDCFVSFGGAPGRLISLRPIYDYLTARGHQVQGEYLVIAGWPVQFLPPTGALVEAALAEAEEVDVEGQPARVMSAEHLAAIALQTGRAKDHARLVQFIDAGALDMDRFARIVRDHGLAIKWAAFQRAFLGGSS